MSKQLPFIVTLTEEEAGQIADTENNLPLNRLDLLH